MPYPIRCFEPGSVYFVTNRCMQSRLLLRPSPQINSIVGATLARALTLFPTIDLFAYVFASNHFHMLLRPRDCDAATVSDFVAYVEANVARRVGRIVKWDGRFWGRRFSAEPVLDNEALVGRLQYILSHGVKEGLTERVADWPGLSCTAELTSGVVRLFDWMDEAARNKKGFTAGAPGARKYVTRYALKLTPLPCWQGVTQREQQRLVGELITEIETRARAERNGKPVLGVEAVLAQDPLDKPLRTNISPRPLCHAASAQLRESFRAASRAFVCAYRTVSALFRQGDLKVDFPPHCFRPTLPWKWRISALSTADPGITATS